MLNGNFMFCCNVDLLDKVEPGDKQTREAFESFKNKFVQQNCHRDVEIRLANVNKQKVLYEDDSLCCCQSELTWKYLHTLQVKSPFFNPNRVYSNTYRQNIEEAVNIKLISVYLNQEKRKFSTKRRFLLFSFLTAKQIFSFHQSQSCSETCNGPEFHYSRYLSELLSVLCVFSSSIII